MSAHAVADYLLGKIDTDAGDTISNLKLQKLMYYCQGWHMAVYGMPLFNEPIEAWKDGPVVPPVYFRFQHFGALSILPDMVRTDPAVDLSEQSRALIDQVWEQYGREFAWSLRNRTHREPAWLQARGTLPAGAASNAPVDEASLPWALSAAD